MSTTSSQFFTNQNLFSTNYLENRMPETDLWKDREMEAAQVFVVIKDAYHDIRELKLGPGEEANLEDRFIRPVLKTLGFEYDVQPTTKRGSKKKRPDYALFTSGVELKEARKDKKNLSRFFSHALTIVEAKYWDRPLNDTVKEDTLDSRDATAQLVKYLEDVHYHSDGKILWGILTNGKLWRLFYYRAASRSGNYYEVDLEEIIRSGNTDTFKYFYLFFARDAFVKDPQIGKTWLDQHLEGSETYARVIGEKLKEKIFDHVFERLAEGFLEYRRNEAGIKIEDEASLKEVFNGCLTLLYRLLFILYAESRELLPVRETHGYYTKSLQKLKEDIVSDLRRGVVLSHRSYDYWSHLETLRRIIDEGDKDLNVPKYNGGLFQSSALNEDQSPEARAIRFVRDYKLADPYLAEAIEALTVDGTDDDTVLAQPGQVQFIDYSSLGVRHLGDIYEGLLEFHVRIAKEEMAEMREKGRSVWKPLSEVKNAKHRRKNPGEVYIENSRHERRAIGSYFTPHYIVEYIVKNTVGPVLEERLKQAQGILEELERLYQKQRRLLKKGGDWHYWEHPGEPKGPDAPLIAQKEGEVFDTLFSLKVLDPAMGSGHFLVHTVDFIADRIIAFLVNHPENPVIRRIEEMRRQILKDVKERQGVEIDENKLTDVNLIKRMVMKRCIYGVDLNPMAVELAKLSLWLDSFTLGAPLSFLDHHLKCGNSLIGAGDVQAQLAPGSERRNDFLRAMSNLLQVAEITDATASEVEQSRQLYREAVKWRYPTQERVNVQIAKHFIPIGNEGKVMEWAYRTERKTDDPLEKPHLETFFAVQALAVDKRFFHWELEFPEVFFKGGVGKESLGFDTVIGNPPYVNPIGLDSAEDTFLRSQFSAAVGKFDMYMLFTEQGLTLCQPNGLFSFIIPNKFIQTKSGRGLRGILSHSGLREVVDFGDSQVFEGVTNYPCIVFAERKEASPSDYLQYRIAKSHPDKVMRELKTPLSQLGEETWFLSDQSEKRLVEKLQHQGLALEKYAKRIFTGIQSGADGILLLTSDKQATLGLEPQLLKPMLRGRCIKRFCMDWDGTQIIYPYDSKGTILPEKVMAKFPNVWRYLQENRAKLQKRIWFDKSAEELSGKWYGLMYIGDPSWFQKDKLVTPALSSEANYSVDEVGYYLLTGTAGGYGLLLQDDADISACFLVAMLNSRTLDFVLKKTSPMFSGGFYKFNEQYLKPLPIRHIVFTTSAIERARLLEKGKKLHECCLAKGDQACVLGFVEHALKQTPEQADVVHDLLAFLAEQMVEMNKAKQTEVRDFLSWLEREIGAKIDDLKNKTRIRNYYEGAFEDLLEVLKGNRRSLTIDPSHRAFQDRLEKEYANSLAKLGPLKARVEATDRLIDQIVYKLYGLTEEEIALMENSAAA